MATVDNCRKSARQFLASNNIKKVTSENLISAITALGYKVIYFNDPDNVIETEELLARLNLLEMSRNSKAFTYKLKSIRVVFIDYTMLERDKVYALAHEAGHIYMGHMDRVNCSYGAIEDEWEANEFAHFVISPSIIDRFKGSIRSKAKLLVIPLIIILLFAAPHVQLNHITASISDTGSKSNESTMNYYVTASGEKYHKHDCRYVKNNNSARKITEKEYHSGKYSACSICNP